MRGEGGSCGVSANEYSCTVKCTQEPKKTLEIYSFLDYGDRGFIMHLCGLYGHNLPQILLYNYWGAPWQGNAKKLSKVFWGLRKIEPLLLRDVHMYPRVCVVEKKMLDFDIRWSTKQPIDLSQSLWFQAKQGLMILVHALWKNKKITNKHHSRTKSAGLKISFQSLYPDKASSHQ
jgi:hypothetical protein